MTEAVIIYKPVHGFAEQITAYVMKELNWNNITQDKKKARKASIDEGIGAQGACQWWERRVGAQFSKLVCHKIHAGSQHWNLNLF